MLDPTANEYRVRNRLAVEAGRGRRLFIRSSPVAIRTWRLAWALLLLCPPLQRPRGRFLSLPLLTLIPLHPSAGGQIRGKPFVSFVVIPSLPFFQELVFDKLLRILQLHSFS